MDKMTEMKDLQALEIRLMRELRMAKTSLAYVRGNKATVKRIELLLWQILAIRTAMGQC